jgi:uncharacterized protein (DUF924 family)
MRSAEDVIDFWFRRHGPDDWFASKPEFDALIAKEFGPTHAHVARGEAWEWRRTVQGRLAEIVVLDQFSRQLFRGKAEAFRQDGMALVLAQEAVRLDADHGVEALWRGFFYLPFMHAESLPVQHEGVRLYQALGDAEQLDYMLGHLHTIERFGRFPFRNKALGRETTAQEAAYMAEAGERSF